jgi:DNA-binding transcriptional regulator YiaG
MPASEVEQPRKNHKRLSSGKDLGGRPPKLKCDDDTLKQINGLARIQCTQREAAAVLGVHRETFSKFLDTNEKAMRAWEDGQEAGKASLRREQFKVAQNGNATMQIWLGKQWLGQKDNLQLGGDPENPLTVIHQILGTFDGATRGLPGAAASGDDGEDVR